LFYPVLPAVYLGKKAGVTNKWTLPKVHKMNTKWDSVSIHLLVWLMSGIVQMTELNLRSMISVRVKEQIISIQVLNSVFLPFQPFKSRRPFISLGWQHH
jgi:hypothetical protein